jgi:membrane protease YdiL (CAAX protease family)
MPPNPEFWRNGNWKLSFIKMAMIIAVSIISIILYNLIAPIKIIYFLGLDMNSLFFKILPVLFICFTFRQRKLRLKETLMQIGLNIKNAEKSLIGLLITLFGLFAVFSSLQLMNADLASLLGLKVGVFNSLFRVYSFLITQIITVAIWEEILFRGYFQNFFFHFFQSKNVHKFLATFFSISIASLIFVFFHFMSFRILTFPLRFINLFFGGLIIGYIYHKSGNLWLSIFAHAGYNVLSGLRNLIMIDRLNFTSKLYFRDCVSKFNLTDGICRNLTQNLVDIMKK